MKKGELTKGKKRLPVGVPYRLDGFHDESYLCSRSQFRGNLVRRESMLRLVENIYKPDGGTHQYSKKVAYE